MNLRALGLLAAPLGLALIASSGLTAAHAGAQSARQGPESQSRLAFAASPARQADPSRDPLGVVPWEQADAAPPFGAAKGLIGEHTVVIVPMEPPLSDASSKSCTWEEAQLIDLSGMVPECPWKGTPQALRQRSLQAVTDAWARWLPGMKVRFEVRDTVNVSQKLCNDPDAAEKAASAAAPDVDYASPFEHLAAIVDCGDGIGRATLTGGFGFMWTAGWIPQTIAHEFGHNVNLMHSNAALCPEGVSPAPGDCKQDEYGDQEDVMGSRTLMIGDGLDVLFAMPSIALSGYNRAAFVGANDLTRADAGKASVARQKAGATAPPLYIPTSIGPVFIDVNTPGNTVDIQGSECPADGVAIRVATAQDTGDTVFGQARLTVDTAALGPVNAADYLDAFPVPGTDKRAIVTERTSRGATVRLIRDANSPKPAPLNPAAVKTTLTAKGYAVRFPKPAGVLGYLVTGTTCPLRAHPGAALVIPTAEAVAAVRARPISLDGVPGKPVLIPLH